ncbi:MAG TPA: hypothetical protein EYQ20_00645 [candidate division Zixibacteria bacterium]|nr:hypothetical protein [candidate division Zixibacteria bacterium]
MGRPDGSGQVRQEYFECVISSDETPASGPYTFILETSRDVPKFMMGKQRTVVIRVPDNGICLSIVKALGRPIISASVATKDDELLNDPDVMEARFGKVVDIIVDGGYSAGITSKWIDTGDAPARQRR